ncbi:secretin N-terminal domain-containing protein [Desulfuromonas sp. DDH964]|uniref:secretin N-terminal domain-containing protein n=1 Tax=Desulfuromonas sp. DDH964 TaxID=1823759 RepID=UPI000835B0CE|nr:secretin N-terminal domain-containing protein [Desulfuromonas sp. DDH964]
MFCVLFVLLALLLGGCAAKKSFVAGEDLMAQGQYDAAVEKYLAAASGDPDTDEYRVKLANARAKAGWAHLQKGRELSAGNELNAAVDEFRRSISYDPSLAVAGLELKQAEARIQAGLLIDEAEDFYRQRRFAPARKNLQQALILDPENLRARTLLEKVQSSGGTILDGQELDVASDKPITLKFKDAQIKEVFSILSKLSGINFLFDEDTKEQKVTVFLEDASFAQALELLLKMNNLGKRVLNPKTVIIYSSSKDKEKQYQDQLIQTFYLSNIDAKKAVNLLRTMLQLRKIYVHEELNALVIRDTPDVIRLAQQIIEAADRGDAEVIYELELVEISHTDNLDIGARLKSYGTSFGFVNPGETSIGDSITVNGMSGLRNLDFLYTIPSATFNLQKTLTDSEILANPKIRVRNKEKAKVHIGSREPVITVTTTGTDTRSDNIQYVDVGVKVEVEPSVQLDNTVITKLGLEVSNVTNRMTTDNGTLALTISTTNANTSLTLKDGETTILGGLIRDDYSKTKNTFPFLGRIPLVGDLLSGHKRDKTKREILLSITPHIVKALELPRSDVASIWSGGEDDLKAGPNFSAFAAPLEAQQNKTAPPPAPGRNPVTQGAAVPGEAEFSVSSLPATPAQPLQPAVTSPAGAGLEGPPPATMSPGNPESALPVLPPPQEPPAMMEVPQAQMPAAASLPLALPPPGTEGKPLPPGNVPEVTLPPLELAPAPAEARIFLKGPGLVTVGEEFVVEVAVDAMQNLYSAPFFLFFPPELCSFVRAEEGEFLGASGASTIFTSSANRDKGQLIIGTKQGAAGTGSSGAGILARVVFTAQAVGRGEITLDRVNFRDPAGNRLSVVTDGLPIEVR